MKFKFISIFITLALIGPVLSKHALRQQQTQSDYTFYQGLDSGGNDIKNVAGQTVDQLKDICNKDPKCAGFNTNGWLKSTLIPQSQWTKWTNVATSGFYVKNPQPAPLQPSYKFYQGLDSNGNDIKNIPGQTVDQLMEICTKEPKCVGFNTNGWIKNALNPQSQWGRWSNDPNQGFYVKIVPPAPLQPSFTFYQGLDSNGNDIKNVPGQTVDQLMDICRNEPKCVAFNTNGWIKNTLIPQSQWSRWSNDPNQGLFVKNPLPPVYTFSQGLDSNGNDIKNVAGQTVDQLKDLCNKEPKCVGFNTNGWLKQSVAPQSQWTRWSNDPNQGFYLKQGGQNSGFFVQKGSLRRRKTINA